MHPRRLDAVDAADGTGEFAFECAQVVDILNETRGAERVGLVENLIADAAALRQAALGEFHPQPRHTILRHHDDAAVVTQLVGNSFAIEFLYDRSRIAKRQVGKKGGHLRRGYAQHQKSEEADKRDRDGAHGGDARERQAF